MKAAVYSRVGPADEVLAIHEVNDPIPMRGEVRVKIAASGINPADVKRRAGEKCRPPQFPFIIPHSDGAGVIDAVGPGVPGTQIGRRVWTWNAQWRRPFGTAANYATVPLEQAVDLPGNVSFDQGASLGVPALTAYYCISRMTFGSNEPIYISGGGGVIGRYAIQMAKSRGATVVTTVSSDCKAELARAAGADLVVNYRTQSIRDVVSGWLGQETIKNFMAVDLAANIDEIRSIAGKFSRIVVYGSATDMAPRLPVLDLQVNNVTIDFISGSEQPAGTRQAGIRDIVELLASDKMTAVGVEPFALSDIAQAHARVESGRNLEKVVVNP